LDQFKIFSNLKNERDCEIVPAKKEVGSKYFGIKHRLNMELDLQLFGLLFTAVPYSLAETPQLPPSPLHLGSYTRAPLVSQDRRQLIVTLRYKDTTIPVQKVPATVRPYTVPGTEHPR
jgi:hypothetical protein